MALAAPASWVHPASAVPYAAPTGSRNTKTDTSGPSTSKATLAAVLGLAAAGRRAKVVARSAASTAELREAAKKNLLNNYGERQLAFTSGQGHILKDPEGEEYLDFTAGIAVNCLGHSDEGWAQVVAKNAAKLCHTSNLYLNEDQVRLGETLVEISFADKAFFCNSGTEANEAAIKFSRKFHFAKGAPREKFIAFENAFHGRTMGALSLTWKEGYKTPFQPVMPSASFLKFNEVEGLEAIDETTCAVFVEPIQGEGGVVPGTVEFMTALRKRCDEVGALLVFDEVQCGLGRSGKLFAYELSGVKPDMMTLAKPLAGGLPIGAVLLTEEVAACINPGDHGSTFAGAPLVCSAARYVVGRVAQESFLKNVEETGARLKAGLEKLAEPHGLAVRGTGLLLGIVFDSAETCGAVQKKAAEEKLLVLTAGAGNVLRIAPALTVGPQDVDVDDALGRLEKAFDAVYATAAA
eukprot:CAMPEP_0181444092 /NCGR_PEP_ID=MMETSP1110-20121109/24888_1 /TAXON_ID=174948 /ORGANISM="Symbiodinium sp., Strain CCMP421" /LENGTH=464 /DNA_ID=CAMNT_0023568083 /DNA_START=39 /DNA_END=1433 /DNA_ORIENTATION=-